ncbi:MAG: CRISPR-associated protein Cas5 [Deltaproteobacteria bacterium]|nr:CRISPR-associated protein Cas5 [Deltaproteobacteria bacterium]
MDVLSFRWHAKYGHFLKAEANRNALTYPVPPRTAVLGLVAAIIGLEKDQLALDLAGTLVSVAGAVPRKFWHKVKLRKDPPAPLPWEVRRNQKGGEGAPEKAALVPQEWLLQPEFVVSVALPEKPERFAELVERVRDRRWHFSPCMGLSEFLADVEFLGVEEGQKLPKSRLWVGGYCLAAEVRLFGEPGLGVQLIRLPRHVSPDRVFTHDSYYLEHRGRPFPVETEAAWQVGERVLTFS